MESCFQSFLHRYSVSCENADLRMLREIARAFSFLPYENVTKILKESRASASQYKLRQAEEVIEDHLRWRTGGTCFSLCNALQVLLQKYGYQCFIAMGDMHYGKNIHCAVIVELQESRFLLDPGYLLHIPIRLPENAQEIRQKTQMNTVVLRSEEPNVISLYTLEAGQLKWRYHLRVSRISEAEFQEHWLKSFSLNSMENLMLSRLDAGARIYFRKDRLDVVREADRQKRVLRVSEFDELSAIFHLPADLISQAQKALIARG